MGKNSNRFRIDVIIRYNRAFRLFCPFSASRCWSLFAGWSTLFWLLLGLRCVTVDKSFIDKTDADFRKHSLNQFLTDAIEGEQLSYSIPKSCLISLHDLHSQSKYRNTNSYRFFLFLKLAETPYSTHGSNKTMNQSCWCDMSWVVI